MYICKYTHILCLQMYLQTTSINECNNRIIPICKFYDLSLNKYSTTKVGITYAQKYCAPYLI